MSRLIDGFCPSRVFPGLRGYAPALDTIPEESTREEFTLPCSKPSRDRFFELVREIPSDGSEGVVSVVTLLDRPEHARVKEIFENHLGVTGSFVKKDLVRGARCLVGKRMGVPLVFGKEVAHTSQVLALGVVNKTSRMFSLVFEPEDLCSDDYVFYELYRLEKEDLCDFILEGRVTGETVTQFTRDIGSALVDLEDEGLLYRDMKPQNVLRTFDGTFSLCDYGFVSHDDDIESLEVSCGTLGYLSPEAGEKILRFSKGEDISRICQKRSDWFSLGIIFYEMVTGRAFLDLGKSRYKNENFHSWRRSMAIFVKKYPEMLAEREVFAIGAEGVVFKGEFSMEAPRLRELFPDEQERAALIDFVPGLLNPDPHERLYGRAALDHPFVTKRFEDVDEAPPPGGGGCALL
jgi:serine/threonine protein kinase